MTLSEVRTPLLQVEHVSKLYGRTVALDDVSMTINRATVHGLVGSNGAGKSTMMKIIAGVTPPTLGEIRLNGNPVDWHSPREANLAGIGTAHQHVEIAQDLSVLENIFLGEGGWRRKDPTLLDRYLKLADLIDCSIDPRTPGRDLSIGQRQLVALMRALASRAEPELVILDEPTAPLAIHERENLFTTIHTLAERGVAVVFVSHFLDEILRVTDEVTVLRDGRVVASTTTKDVNEDALVELIVGRQLLAVERTAKAVVENDAETALEATDLRLYDDSEASSFSVRAGEIVGVAGLIGSGRSRLLRTLFAVEQPRTGELRLFGRPYPTSTAEAVDRGVGFVPEDRTRQGIMKEWEIWRNVSLPSLKNLARRSFGSNRGRERVLAEDAVRRLSIRADSVDAVVSRLSGGNAQKVVVAKWLAINPRLLLLDDPVVGVDVGAKADILQAIRELASSTGCAVVMVSSDFDELLAVASRVLVLRRGVITHEASTAALTKADLVALSGGVVMEEETEAAWLS